MADADTIRTALSSGLIVSHLLAPLGYELFPVYNYLPDHFPEGPAIAFRRTAMQCDPVKGLRARCKVSVEVSCYHSDYAASVGMAEQAAAAIEGREGTLDALRLTAATLDGSSEAYVGDKFVQILTFTLTITPLCKTTSTARTSS